MKIRSLRMPLVLTVLTFNLNAQQIGGGGGNGIAAPNTLRLLTPVNNSRYVVGSDLRIEWKHNPAHAGKTVQLHIRLSDLNHAALADDASVTIAGKNVSIATSPSNGTWSWHIPSSFKSGAYRINVSEFYSGSGSIEDPPDPPGGSWDYALIRIGPVSAIKFASRYGQSFQVGNFPKFDFTMVGAESTELRIFVRKDGAFLGRLAGGYGYTPELENGTVYWSLTRYIGTNGVYALPKPGSGYSILAGIAKDPSRNDFSSSYTLDDFADFDETDRFALSPPRPLIIEAIYFDGVNKKANMYVIGEPGVRYTLHYTRDLILPWKEQVAFIAGDEVVPIMATLPPNLTTIGFFALKRSAMTTLGYAETGKKEVHFAVSPTR